MRKFFKFEFILIYSFILIFVLTNIYINKFSEQYFISGDYKHSSLYQEDVISYFKVSDRISKDIADGKKIYNSGGPYSFSFLHPRLIYFFNNFFNSNEEIINSATLKIHLKNYNFFLYFQIIFFYLSTLFLHRSLLKIFDKSLSNIICIVLLLNPIIFQWHLSFYTESIFLSFLIILICFLLRSKSWLHFLFIGLFVGIIYTQRTIALLYPIVIFSYIFFLNHNVRKKLFKISSLLIGMSLILILIGIYNYNRSGIFYFTPIQSKSDIQTYLEADVLKLSKKISYEDARNELINFNKSIINTYGYNLQKESDKIKYLNKVQKNSFNTLIANKTITLQIIIKNYLHAMLLNPVQVFYETKYQNWIDYKKSDEHKFWLIVRIIITPIFFIMTGLGMIFSIKKVEFKYNVFLFLSVIYFTSVSCWLPNTRYFVPSVLFMSIYFSIFLHQISLLLKKSKLF